MGLTDKLDDAKDALKDAGDKVAEQVDIAKDKLEGKAKQQSDDPATQVEGTAQEKAADVREKLN